jgi:hypothetical protein
MKLRCLFLQNEQPGAEPLISRFVIHQSLEPSLVISHSRAVCFVWRVRNPGNAEAETRDPSRQPREGDMMNEAGKPSVSRGLDNNPLKEAVLAPIYGGRGQFADIAPRVLIGVKDVQLRWQG